MRARPSARSAMRAATCADHERVDAAFGRFDLTVPEGYTAFLQAQAEAFLPVEAAIDRAHPERVVDDWPDRRRGRCVAADLAELGVEPPVVSASFACPTAEAVLGAIYVLEGSRLGGRMLARSVPDHLPRRFLAAGDPGLWRKLIETLDARLVSEAQLAAAVTAAREVFALFEAGARHHPGAVS